MMSDTESDDTHSTADRSTNGQNEASDRVPPESSSLTTRSRDPERTVTDGSVRAFLQSEPALTQLKSALILFATTGVVLGIVGSVFSSRVGAFAGDIAVATFVPIGLVTPAIGIVMGQQVGRTQFRVRPLAVYALVVLVTGVGAIVQFMLASTLIAVEISGTSVAELFALSLVVALGTVIASLAGTFTVRNGN